MCVCVNVWLSEVLEAYRLIASVRKRSSVFVQIKVIDGFFFAWMFVSLQSFQDSGNIMCIELNKIIFVFVYSTESDYPNKG